MGMEIGTTTVDCVNAERCNGQVTMRLEGWTGTPDDAEGEGVVIGADPAYSQTCTCTYSADDWETLVGRARDKLGR